MANGFMYTVYPDAIDTSNQIPIVTDNVTEVKGEVVNRYREGILAIEGELGIQPSGTYTTVRDRLDALEALLNGLNIDGSIEIKEDGDTVVELGRALNFAGGHFSVNATSDTEAQILLNIIVTQQTLLASGIADEDGYAEIDFNNGVAVDLLLDISLEKITFIPPNIPTGYSIAVCVYFFQGTGGSKTIGEYVGGVFFGETDITNGLSTDEGYVDVIASKYNPVDGQLRFMLTPGAPQ